MKKMKGKQREKRKEKKTRALYTFYNLKSSGEAVLPNVFQNDSNSTRGAAPPKEPEPKPDPFSV
jgi:hypothetical protein